jgi:predicted ATP-dependent endonuclease of OLD family
MRRLVIVVGMNNAGKTAWIQRQPQQQYDFSVETSLLRRGLTAEALAQLSQAPTAQRLYIDKPETQLHPRAQTELADLFVAATLQSFIIETHSEPLISRLGEMISEGRLDRDEVEVYLLHRHEGNLQLRRTTFDAEGMLSDWPPGCLTG